MTIDIMHNDPKFHDGKEDIDGDTEYERARDDKTIAEIESKEKAE